MRFDTCSLPALRAAAMLELAWGPARTLPTTGFLVGITIVFVIAVVSLVSAVLLTVLLLRNRCVAAFAAPRDAAAAPPVSCAHAARVRVVVPRRQRLETKCPQLLWPLVWQCVADAVWSLAAGLMVLPPLAAMSYPTPIENPGCVPLGSSQTCHR